MSAVRSPTRPFGLFPLFVSLGITAAAARTSTWTTTFVLLFVLLLLFSLLLSIFVGTGGRRSSALLQLSLILFGIALHKMCVIPSIGIDTETGRKWWTEFAFGFFDFLLRFRRFFLSIRRSTACWTWSMPRRVAVVVDFLFPSAPHRIFFGQTIVKRNMMNRPFEKTMPRSRRHSSESSRFRWKWMNEVSRAEWLVERLTNRCVDVSSYLLLVLFSLVFETYFSTQQIERREEHVLCCICAIFDKYFPERTLTSLCSASSTIVMEPGNEDNSSAVAEALIEVTEKDAEREKIIAFVNPKS